MTTRRQLQNKPQGKHRPRRVTPIVGGPPRVMTVKQFMLGLISKDEARDLLDLISKRVFTPPSPDDLHPALFKMVPR